LAINPEVTIKLFSSAEKAIPVFMKNHQVTFPHHSMLRKVFNTLFLCL